MDTEDYHESVPVTARVTVTRHGRVIIISIHGIMHLLLGNQNQVESAHAQHAVALSTRRMRSNKIEFSQLKTSLRERKQLERQRNKTLEHQESLQKAT